MIFSHADKNHDGKLTKDEVPAPMWEHLSNADADKDGAVTKEELEKHMQKRRAEQKPEPKKDQPAEEEPKLPKA